MPDSVPLRGSAYHPAGGTRPGHRRLRKLDDAELQADAGVTLMLRERTKRADDGAEPRVAAVASRTRARVISTSIS